MSGSADTTGELNLAVAWNRADAVLRGATEADDVLARDVLALVGRVSALAAELRDEFFRQLPDMDYEKVIPGSGEVDWAWAQHPWFALLDLDRAVCVARLRERAAVGPGEETAG